MSLKKLSGNQQLFHLISCSMVSSSSPGSEACRENPATRTLWNRLQHPHHQTMPLPAFPGVGSPSPAGNILSLKERGLMFLGKPSESQGKHTWEGAQRLTAKLLTPLSPSSFSLTCQLWESHFSEYYPTFLIAITLQVSSRLLVLHSKT